MARLLDEGSKCCVGMICLALWVYIALIFLYVYQITTVACFWSWPCDQLAVGCDGRIRSDKTCDVCGVCGGLNNTWIMGQYCTNTQGSLKCPSPSYPPPPLREAKFTPITSRKRSLEDIRDLLDARRIVL